MKYIIFLVLYLCLLSNCATFHHKSGKVKSFLPPKDQAKFYKKDFDVHDFDFHNFGKDTQQHSQFPYAEYFTPNALEAFKIKYPKTLILFWNPSCAASKKLFLYAQKLDSMKIPVVLVSINYALPNIVANIQNSRFKNRVIYILAPNHEKTNIVISKIRTFVKEACNVCYEQYMDQLCSTKALIISKESTIPLFKINEHEIKKEFNFISD